jgi:hypothetical protein
VWQDTIDCKSPYLRQDMNGEHQTKTLQDLPGVKAENMKPGVGKSFINDLCAVIASTLQKGVVAKATWVTKGSNSDSHAIATAAKIHTHTINYINAINSLPNDPPPNTLNPMTGEVEELEAALEPEDVPEDIDPAILLKSILLMDYVASAEEPNLDAASSSS